MWRLTLLCGCVQLGGLAFLFLLPSGAAEQAAMQRAGADRSSKAAGATFLAVVRPF
jgi:hypothetical protein